MTFLSAMGRLVAQWSQPVAGNLTSPGGNSPQTAKRDTKNPSAPNTNEVESPPKTKGRGRPQLWEGHPLSPEDRACAAELEKRFGPDEEASRVFEERYRAFCKVNSLDPADGRSALLALGQARNPNRKNPAFSSLNTQFTTLIKRKIIAKNTFAVKTILRNAASDSSATQPRLFDPTIPSTEEGIQKLGRMVEEIPEVEDEAICALQLLSGWRTQTVVRLRGCQLKVKPKWLTVERRWSKTNRKRETFDLQFAWTRKPSARVLSFFKDQEGNQELIWPQWCKAKSDGHITRSNV